jgi:hypothetical protein
MGPFTIRLCSEPSVASVCTVILTALGSVLCVRLLSGRRFGCRRGNAGKLTDSREYFSPMS